VARAVEGRIVKKRLAVCMTGASLGVSTLIYSGVSLFTADRLTRPTNNEQANIRAVMTWAQEAGFSNDRVGWLGNSMGGSTILMEAARNPLINVL
jgi:dienelactone hydrolase